MIHEFSDEAHRHVRGGLCDAVGRDWIDRRGFGLNCGYCSAERLLTLACTNRRPGRCATANARSTATLPFRSKVNQVLSHDCTMLVTEAMCTTAPRGPFSSRSWRFHRGAGNLVLAPRREEGPRQGSKPGQRRRRRYPSAIRASARYEPTWPVTPGTEPVPCNRGARYHGVPVV